MCIIITKEFGAKPLPKDVFSRCWDRNPDGAGILYNDGHVTTLCKGIMKKEDFMRKVAEVNKKENCFVIHTRIKTHGSVKPENTHPFVSKTLGFAHNGVLSVQALPDTTDSETFFKWTLEDKTFDWCLENNFLLDMATNGSRCVIFDMLTGKMLHLCEDAWVKDEKYPGYMFSNSNYKDYSSSWSSRRNYCGCGIGYDWDDEDDWERWQRDYSDRQQLTDFSDVGANKPTLLDQKAFDEFASKVSILGLKRKDYYFNIDAREVDTYLRNNCKIYANSEDFANIAKMLVDMKRYEKDTEMEMGIASPTYMASRIIRQWFGRAKSLGFTNVPEILMSINEYIEDMKDYMEDGKANNLFTEQEKTLLKEIEATTETYEQIFLEDIEDINEALNNEIKENENAVSDKDDKSGVSTEQDTEKQIQQSA